MSLGWKFQDFKLVIKKFVSKSICVEALLVMGGGDCKCLYSFDSDVYLDVKGCRFES